MNYPDGEEPPPPRRQASTDVHRRLGLGDRRDEPDDDDVADERQGCGSGANWRSWFGRRRADRSQGASQDQGRGRGPYQRGRSSTSSGRRRPASCASLSSRTCSPDLVPRLCSRSPIRRRHIFEAELDLTSALLVATSLPPTPCFLSTQVRPAMIAPPPVHLLPLLGRLYLSLMT